MASPNKIGVCPFCGNKVISKCGETNVWHWAHANDANCDSWYEPETFWHKHWKRTFGEENVEIRIEKDGKRHIADIYTNNNVVIELQNSPILKQDIRIRENFYGEQMLWVINGIDFRKNLVAKDYWEDEDYLEQKGLPRKPARWIRSGPEIKKGINGEFFSWKYPRKSWADVKRPLFIDFGEDTVFRVIEGMGTFQIRGTYFSKEKFIKKYGGNYQFYLDENE